jgi:hypothetical protein
MSYDRAIALGIDLSDIDVPSNAIDSASDKLIEAEATLLYYELKGRGFIQQICPTCNEKFAYKYKIRNGKMQCSNRCRKIALEALGIKWRPDRPLEDRWARGVRTGMLPLIVPPEALQAVTEALEDATDVE